MRAVVAIRQGGPEVLELKDVPDTPVDRDQVLIKVHRAGVNFADLLSTLGLYAETPPPPFIPGLEVSGTDVRTGRPVIAIVRSGGYAERVNADPRMVFLADGLDLDLAAGYLLVGLTAHLALAEVARLRPGETVLVTGAAGGVGTATIQVAQALGAGRVIGMASTPHKRDLVRDVGADSAIGYDDVIPYPVDVVVEVVGDDVFQKVLPSVRPLGRVVLIGASSGRLQQIPTVGDLRVRNVGVFPFSLGAMRRLQPDLFSERAAAGVALIRQGRLRPPIGRVLPLADAPKAHRLLASRQATGKILLDVEHGERASP